MYRRSPPGPGPIAIHTRNPFQVELLWAGNALAAALKGKLGHLAGALTATTTPVTFPKAMRGLHFGGTSAAVAFGNVAQLQSIHFKRSSYLAIGAVANISDAFWFSMSDSIQGFEFGNSFNGTINVLALTLQRPTTSVQKGITNDITTRYPRPATIIATYDGTETNTAINIYVDGVLGTGDAVSTTAGSGVAAAQTSAAFNLGHSPSGSMTGELYLAAVASKTWSDAEVASLTQNPWQLLNWIQRL